MSAKGASFLVPKKKRKVFVDLKQFFDGDHAFSAMIYGDSRAGKTNWMVKILDSFIKRRHYNFTNDNAKGFDQRTYTPKSELLYYFSEDLEAIEGVRILVPEGCGVEIEGEHKYKIYEVRSYDDIFEAIGKGGPYVNVISLDPFILSPLAAARFWALFVIELRLRTIPKKEGKRMVPLAGALDQINFIFPSRALRLSGFGGHLQSKAANWFGRFMYDSAGSGVRIIATSHAIRVVKKPIRSAFLWKFFKASSEEVGEVASRLSKCQGLVETLKIDETFAVDDANKWFIYTDLPHIKYESSPVYYEGERILDDLWMLESDYQELVMTSQELKALGKDKTDTTELERALEEVEKLTEEREILTRELEARKVGDRFLSGEILDDIADDLGFSKGTAVNRLHWCRANVHGFRQREKSRVRSKKVVIPA